MKKIFLILLMAGLLFSLISYGLTFRNSIEAETFEELIESVLDFLFYIGLAAVPLMVVLGGFFIATAGGDSKRFKRGSKLYNLCGNWISRFTFGPGNNCFYQACHRL